MNNPAFDKSIVGISNDGRIIYDFEKMIVEFMEDEKCSLTDAIEFIENNTLIAVPFMNGERKPIIMETNIEELIEKYGG